MATAAVALTATSDAFDDLNGVAVEPEAELVAPTVSPARLAWAAGLAPFVAAAAQTQTATAEAHDAFLRVQNGFTRVAAEAVRVQNELVRRLLGA